MVDKQEGNERASETKWEKILKDAQNGDLKREINFSCLVSHPLAASIGSKGTSG